MYISLDSIVKGALLNRGYSLHWYFRFLNYGANCVQELGFNTLKNINCQLITVDSFGQADLPRDYVDWVKVGLQNGQQVDALRQAERFNRMASIDPEGNQLQRGFGQNGNWDYTDEGIGLGWNSGYFNGFYGCYNLGNATDRKGFQILREQNKIQLAEFRAGQSIVLEYVSTTGCADMLTKINPLAKFAIQAFIEWQHKRNSKSYSLGEIAMAEKSWTVKWGQLRSLLNPITCDGIISAHNEATLKRSGRYGLSFLPGSLMPTGTSAQPDSDTAGNPIPTSPAPIPLLLFYTFDHTFDSTFGGTGSAPSLVFDYTFSNLFN